MPPATVATVEVVATLARVGVRVGACVGAHAGSALRARYRGARTREQPRLRCVKMAKTANYTGAHTREQPSRTGEVSSPVAPPEGARPRGDRYSQRAKTRDRGAAQFMSMK